MKVILLPIVILVVFLCSIALHGPINNPMAPGSEALVKAEQVAEELRQEPWELFRNNCFHKSFRFRRQCRDLGIEARAVLCIGIVGEEWFGYQVLAPKLHAWGEVEGRRIEVARPLGDVGMFGADPRDIKPVIAIWI